MVCLLAARVPELSPSQGSLLILRHVIKYAAGPRSAMRQDGAERAVAQV